MEARGGIEPPIKVLQTFALPLGYRASEPGLRSSYRMCKDNSFVHACVNDFKLIYDATSVRVLSCLLRKMLAGREKSIWNLEMEKNGA
jgi:hypothetical protein